MVQRLALLVASLVAALSLATGLVVAGFMPRPAPAGAAQVTPAAPVDAGAAATPAPTVQVDTVYVPAPAAPEVITVHKVARASGDGEDGEHEEDD